MSLFCDDPNEPPPTLRKSIIMWAVALLINSPLIFVLVLVVLHDINLIWLGTCGDV